MGLSFLQVSKQEVDTVKLSDINEYLQTLATLGALVGLLVVGYEVRQSNAIAVADSTSAAWTNWTSTSLSLMESGFSETRAKSMTNPEGLTLPEKIDLDFFLQSWVYSYMLDLEAMYVLGEDEFIPYLYQEAAQEAPRIFGSKFSRGWLQENKYWIAPDLVKAIEESLNDAPIGSDLEYYARIDALGAAIK